MLLYFYDISGAQCDIDINECLSNPCYNNGSCTEPLPGEYQCECPLEISGSTCDLVQGVHIHAGGHLELSYPNSTADVTTIAFSYETFSTNGVLLWTSSQVERGEHPHLLLVELVEGSIRVVMETGSEKAELTQRLAGKTVQLHIGKDGIALSQPPSVFTEDSVVRGTEEFLRRLTHLSLGLPDHWTPFLRSNAQSGDNFEGCVGNLTINNVVVDLDEATDIRGVELGCKPVTPCSPNFCHNNGTCSESWLGAPVCRCLDGYSGDRCQVRDSVEFSANEMLHLPSANSISVVFFQVALRNISQYAVLMYTISGNKVAITPSFRGDNCSFTWSWLLFNLLTQSH
ncbi:AGRN [Bugula neritina]|uniref:AGRN n=1 Tax=Bugula neritina TaxID=10212 RepID=A0A7J7IRH4_BUGNE|nr:AGRN [Bugula neritina]